MHLSESQSQTADSFSFKWSKTTTYESSAVHAEWKRWLLEKYFDGDAEGPSRLLADRGRLRILDAGCGAGISSLLIFGESLMDHDYVGVDISSSVREAERNFASNGIPGQFVQANISDLPESLGEFDLIFSEGVLHHTDSVERTLANLASRLRFGGKIAFYVYARKAPVREFTDDYVRSAIASMTDEQAWRALMPLTKLGQSLGQLDVEVTIDEDIEVLGIASGSYNLQRLFYYAFCKAYYRPDYSVEEMNHVNFDWYRPLNCHRHSGDEIVAFCSTAGLRILRFHEEPSGLTVIAERVE